MSVYKVKGPLRYREHRPGETFIAELPPDVETRAVKAGAIEIVHRGPLTVNLAGCRPPQGWQRTRTA